MLVGLRGVIREERRVGAVKVRFLLTMHRRRVQGVTTAVAETGALNGIEESKL